MRIVEELIEIWLNEACDTKLLNIKNGISENRGAE